MLESLIVHGVEFPLLLSAVLSSAFSFHALQMRASSFDLLLPSLFLLFAWFLYDTI